MQTRRAFLMFASAAAVAVPLTPAFAATTFVGVIKRIEVAPDGKSANVILKMNKGGKDITIFIKDELTLNKFKIHKIQEGDEIRCRYDVEDGKNLSKSFLRTAGC